MLKTYRIFFGSAMAFASFTSQAFDGTQLIPVDASGQRCFSAAMIGMDSVINSRLGVLPERGVELAKRRALVGDDNDDATFSTDLLRTIFNAYMWDGSPHSYAVTVFYQCAQKQSAVQGTSIYAFE